MAQQGELVGLSMELFLKIFKCKKCVYFSDINHVFSIILSI